MCIQLDIFYNITILLKFALLAAQYNPLNSLLSHVCVGDIHCTIVCLRVFVLFNRSLLWFDVFFQLKRMVTVINKE